MNQTTSKPNMVVPPHQQIDGFDNRLFSLGKLERAKGFEPSTPTLAKLSFATPCFPKLP